MREWHKRGYVYCGLDLSPAMIEFAREKAQLFGIERPSLSWAWSLLRSTKSLK